MDPPAAGSPGRGSLWKKKASRWEEAFSSPLSQADHAGSVTTHNTPQAQKQGTRAGPLGGMEEGCQLTDLSTGYPHHHQGKRQINKLVPKNFEYKELFLLAFAFFFLNSIIVSFFSLRCDKCLELPKGTPLDL